MKDWLRTFGKPSTTNSSGYAITTSQESLVVSILSAGTFFGWFISESGLLYLSPPCPKVLSPVHPLLISSAENGVSLLPV